MPGFRFVRIVARVLFFAVGCGAALPLGAQRIVRDSLLDVADNYWRGRMLLTVPSGDTLIVTCEEAGVTWQPAIRLVATQPWSPDALSTSTSNIFGFNSTNTGSRMVMVWPDGRRDRWQIIFMSSRGVNWSGATVADASAANRAASSSRAGWLSTPDLFMDQMLKHGRVAITYPTSDWVRSFEMVLSEDQRTALRGMNERCTKRYEGTKRAAGAAR